MKSCRDISTGWAIAVYILVLLIAVLLMIFLYTNCAAQENVHTISATKEKAQVEQKEVPQIKEFIKIYFNDITLFNETNCGMANETFRRYVNQRLYFYFRHGYRVTNIRCASHGGFPWDVESEPGCYEYIAVWLEEK